MSNKKVKVCAVCGKEFLTVYDNALYCSPECRRVRDNRYRREYARRMKKKSYPPIKCPICGKEFVPCNSNAVLCGDPECKKEYTIQYRKRILEQQRNTIVTRKCEICGKEFQLPANSNVTVCSKECGSAKRKKTRIHMQSLDYQYVKRTKKKKNNAKEINDINNQARAEHLSYGEYVARQYIEKHNL